MAEKCVDIKNDFSLFRIHWLERTTFPQKFCGNVSELKSAKHSYLYQMLSHDWHTDIESLRDVFVMVLFLLT